MSLTNNNNTSIDSALIFKMAATVVEKNPDLDMEKAMAIAQEFASSGFMDHLGINSRNIQTSSKSKKEKEKEKKPVPKRHKNAYMFYLAQHRGAITKELHSAIAGAENQPSDITQLLSDNGVEKVTDGSDVKVPVKLVTKLAGTRWKKLALDKQDGESEDDHVARIQQKKSFEDMADADKAQKKADFDALNADA